MLSNTASKSFNQGLAKARYWTKFWYYEEFGSFWFVTSPLVPFPRVHLIPKLGDCFTYGGVLGLMQETVRNNAMLNIRVHCTFLKSLPLKEIFIFIEILFSHEEFILC